MLLYFKQLVGSILAAEMIADASTGTGLPEQPALERGRYLAGTICTECHGADLRGAEDGSSPSLAIAISYSYENFYTLMHEGTPIGGRELDLMAQVTQSRFKYFTDSEISALHEYLQTLVSTAPVVSN
jgi:mono/diheme cytochrome c family protein